jgi:sec-independent protein translocase protein TatC
MKYRCFYLLISAFLTFCLCSSSQLELFYLIGKPFLQIQQTFVFLDLTEALYTVLRLSFLITGVLWIPFLVYQVWSFFIPSCYKFQRRKLNFFCMFFWGWVVVELGIIFFLLVPQIFHFLLSFEMTSYTCENSHNLGPLVNVEFTARINSYVSLLMKLCLSLFLFFQIPFCFYFLFSKKILRASSFSSNRKICNLMCLLLSAFLVPPDLVTQLLVASFFSFVCEFLIFIGFFFEDPL